MKARMLWRAMAALAAIGAQPAAADPAGGKPGAPEWSWSEPIYEFAFSKQTPEGTFRAFEARLPALKRLGVGILWTMPIHPPGKMMPDIAWLRASGGCPLPVPPEQLKPKRFPSPYCVQDHRAVNPRFGTPDDLRHLVGEIHRSGMHLILDFVPNHAAWDSVLAREHPDYFLRNDKGLVKWVGGWLDIAQLDFSNRKVWDYMRDALVYWIKEFDVDGFRCDVAERIPIEFWCWLRPQLLAVKPVFLLAEAEGPAFHPVFDATYDWTLAPTVWNIVHFAKPASAIDDLLKAEEAAYHPPFFRMRHLTNHDTQDSGYPWPARKINPIPFLDNTPLAEKFGRADRAAAILCATLPYSKPMLWNGQEIGLLAKTPTPIPWKDSPYLVFYARLLHLYRLEPALITGAYRKLGTGRDDKVFAFARGDGVRGAVVVLNLSAEPQGARLPEKSLTSSWRELFTEARAASQTGALDLEPWACRVYVPEAALAAVKRAIGK